jgi:DNA repair photolyase
MKKRFGQIKTYEKWIEPYLVSNTLQLLDKEIPKLRNKIKSVQLCFTTDPFMYGYQQISKMSIDSIKKLNDNGIKCVVLTKGILPKALSTLSKSNEYGITLITLDDDFRKKMEPGSAPLKKRVSALRALHDAGYKTWVSIEPYPTPNIKQQDLEEILNTIDFVDKIVFGRMHYNRNVSAYKNYHSFFNDSANQVIKFCKKHNIAYHIKTGTITK